MMWKSLDHLMRIDVYVVRYVRSLVNLALIVDQEYLQKRKAYVDLHV